MIRTLIVDDHDDMRLLMRLLLTVDDLCVIAAEASNGVQALSEWARVEPDVVVLDLRMDDLSGLDVASCMLTADPDARIVVCSGFLEREAREQARELGVTAVIDKHDISCLSEVVAAAMAG